MNKWFKRKNKATGSFFQVVKTVAYDAEVFLALETHLQTVKALTSSGKAVSIPLFRSGRNAAFRLMSSVFAVTNERFTGVHKTTGQYDQGKPIVAANSGINLGEQEFRALARYFQQLKQMILANKE